MENTSKAHTGIVAIRKFMAIAHALILRGHYSLSGTSGQALEDALRTLIRKDPAGQETQNLLQRRLGRNEFCSDAWNQRDLRHSNPFDLSL